MFQRATGHLRFASVAEMYEARRGHDAEIPLYTHPASQQPQTADTGMVTDEMVDIVTAEIINADTLYGAGLLNAVSAGLNKVVPMLAASNEKADD